MKYTAADIDRYIDLYLNSFEKVLYEEDSQFMEGMKTRSLAGDDIRRYQFWEWTQGVGLYIAGRRGIDQNKVVFAGNLCQAHGQKHIDTGAFGLFQDLQLLGRHWGVAICRNYIKSKYAK